MMMRSRDELEKYCDDLTHTNREYESLRLSRMCGELLLDIRDLLMGLNAKMEIQAARSPDGDD
jgi:hypothetical protein